MPTSAGGTHTIQAGGTCPVPPAPTHKTEPHVPKIARARIAVFQVHNIAHGLPFPPKPVAFAIEVVRDLPRHPVVCNFPNLFYTGRKSYIHFKYRTNEKVAMEVAAGWADAGLRNMAVNQTRRVKCRMHSITE